MTSLKAKIYCQVCDNPLYIQVMDLGKLPLPDQLIPAGSERTVPKYPTEIMYCQTCRTAHIKDVMNNREVFPREYHYRAANTKDVLTGMESLVDAVEKRGLVKGLQVLDIGCNDGSLLDAFAKRGAITYGIEPTDAAQEAEAKGHSVDQVYFDITQAHRYVRRYGHPDLITFVNVFAHIEDFAGLQRALAALNGPDTIMVIENHYLGSVLDRNQFDTFYHEHPRTYSYTSFMYIAENLGKHVAHVEFPSRYGGNIRAFLYPGRDHEAQRLDIIEREVDFCPRLKLLGQRVGQWQKAKTEQLRTLGRIPAAAMPGRATILFNLLGLEAENISGVYEVPRSRKIGYYVPGTRIPIVSDADFPWADYSGPVLNMAWHIPNEIEANWRAKGFRGSFIQAVDPGDFN
jgi:D-mycarose 3-C-methyltransferase